MIAILDAVNSFLWGVPVLFLILAVGIMLGIRCGIPQIRFLPAALKAFVGGLFRRDESDGTTSFRALCTALAATVGTGNIAGVAGAIAIGGPGAVFWMWVSGFLGMGIKFAESTLALRYRVCNSSGEWIGGPMYMIRQGMGKRWHFLGGLYAFFGLIAAFGVGNATQVNAVINSVGEFASQSGFAVGPKTNLVIGMILALMVWLTVSGGAKRIGHTAEMLIPLVSGVYVLLCLIAIVLHGKEMQKVIGTIFSGAFSPEAVTGGAVGSMTVALRIGISRGVFTNEAGMGTAAIAHAGASVAQPIEQGLMGIVEVFIDTIVICTLTALVILTSGTKVPYGVGAGSELTVRALSVSFGPWVSALLSACLCCFALATILGWGLYAGRCAEYLFGNVNWKLFALFQSCGVILGALLETGVLWTLAELMNALMALPNLIVLLALSPELAVITKQYRPGSG